jgi:hypothetical protein
MNYVKFGMELHYKCCYSFAWNTFIYKGWKENSGNVGGIWLIFY